MKIVIALILIVIIASLGSAMFFLIKDTSQKKRTLKALTVRIGISVVLFIFIIIAYHMGWIEATGIRY